LIGSWKECFAKLDEVDAKRPPARDGARWASRATTNASSSAASPLPEAVRDLA